MSDIFISYASQDKKKADLLAKVLEEQGWSVWWDRKIPPGRTFSDVIKEALDSTKCVVVLWSKASIQSDWVLDEATVGVRRKILVPAFIENVEIPLGFGRIHAAQLVGWQGKTTDPNVQELIESLASLVGYPKVEKSKHYSKVSNAVNTKDKQRVIPKGRIKTLRNTSMNLSSKAFKAMLIKNDFFDENGNPSGNGFNNDFEPQKDGKVVFDHASGLMWQQCGSGRNMSTYEEYIAQLNLDQFAGFSDWRLPTLEEAVSLIEPEQKKNGLHIDPVFDSKQVRIWTSDLHRVWLNGVHAWVVNFDGGYCYGNNAGNFYFCVRSVR